MSVSACPKCLLQLVHGVRMSGSVPAEVEPPISLLVEVSTNIEELLVDEKKKRERILEFKQAHGREHH